jgi:3-polyprenyl-4-hydroxybenzoate decarboxylase
VGIRVSFQTDKDLVVFDGMEGMPMDPSLVGKSVIGAKVGFDLILPLQSHSKLTTQVATALKLESSARYQTVLQALEDNSSLYFTDIVDALRSRDSREIALQLDELRNEGKLMCNNNGKYFLGQAEKVKLTFLAPSMGPKCPY